MRRVYLFCSNMDLGIIVGSAVRVARKYLGDNFPPECTTHWTLGCDCGDGSAILVDYTQVEKQRLRAVVTFTTAERLEEMKEEAATWHLLGRRLNFTHVKLANKVKDLSDMGEYALIDQNCQEALCELLSLLDIELPAGVKTLRQALNAAGAQVSADDKA
ncbi:hypothetical protein MTO96_026762 [Rhipicephalus appendiculatus]